CGGSMGFMGAARAAILVPRDPKDGPRRLFLAHKLNIAPKPTGLAFRIGGSGIDWEGRPVTATAQEVLGPDAATGKATRQEDRAVDLLSELLERGPVAQHVIEDRAKAEGIARSTLYRARARLGVTSKKMRSGYGDDVLVWWRPGRPPEAGPGGPGSEYLSQGDLGLGLGRSQSQIPVLSDGVSLPALPAMSESESAVAPALPKKNSIGPSLQAEGIRT